MYNSMKALSWKEPYASLMLYGKIETRTWYTYYRGPVLICASKKDYKIDEIMRISGDQFSHLLDVLNNGQHLKSYSGHAIAIGELIDCRPMTKADEAKCFVTYKPNLFCHIYKDVTPIEPIPWQGSQGWKNVPQAVIEKIVKKEVQHG